MKTDIGIYVHVPFCASKCYYCDFFSRVSSPEKRRDYVTKVRNQIRAHDRFSPSTVYIGGGTPSVLSPDEAKEILSALNETFDMTSVREFTVEMNPESVTDEILETFIRGGCNRVSLGIQSFNDEELRLCGRRHTADTARIAIEKIRRFGIENISVDLIIGLPGQTEESLLSSLAELVALDIPHISAYILKVEENTVFSRKNVSEPDEETASRLYLATSDFLRSSGYEHYEISNFSKPGKRALHNSSYWQGKNYVAFGPGAYGYEDGVRYHYGEDFEKTVDEYVDESEKARELVMLSLRTSDGICIVEMSPENLDFAARLEKSGLGRFFSDRFALTPSGFLVSNAVISEMLSTR